MPKRILVIRASDDICAAEVVHVAQICELFGMHAIQHEWTDSVSFLIWMQAQQPFDYIYLAAHAGPSGFGESSDPSTSWTDLSSALCQSGKLNSGCVLFLGCCRGGLRVVADTIFVNCTQVDYVCGPRWTVRGEDIVVGFHVFLYNMEIRKEQPSCAAERTSRATNYDFFCYDRVEAEDRLGIVEVKL